MLLDLLQKRRSIRRFTEVPIQQQLIDQLLQAALLSPSSRSLCPWEFIVVDDPQLIRALSEAKEHGSSFLYHAPLAIVVLGIPEQSDVWIEDVSIASSHLLLAAEDLGLGACWIQIRLRKTSDGRNSDEYVRNQLGIDKSRSVESIIAIGYPKEHPSPTPLDRVNWEKVQYNHWSN